MARLQKNSHTLMVGIQNSTAFLDSLLLSYKAKHTFTSMAHQFYSYRVETFKVKSKVTVHTNIWTQIFIGTILIIIRR